MAGIIGEVNNNLLGLQQLAQTRQDMDARKTLIEDNKIATDNLRRFHESQQSGNPDYSAFNEAVLRSPELASNVLKSIGVQESRQGRDASSFIAQAALSLDDPDRFMSLAQNRIKYLQEAGRDPKDTISLVESYAKGDKEAARRDLQSVGAALTNQGYLDKDVYSQVFGVGGDAEFNSITQGFSEEEKAQYRRVKAGLAPRAVGSAAITTALGGLTDYVADSQATIAGRTEGSKTSADIAARVAGGGQAEEIESEKSVTGKDAAERRALFKTQAIAAAENVPTLRRAIELQDAINTGGGINALRKVANYLGVASQDEGELNSLFGQNILGQLKSTFGGNPTEGEREALAQAQASFNQTGKINSKLLRNALRLADAKVQRGKRAAQADKDDATFNEIDAALNISLGDTPKQSAPASGGWAIRPVGGQ